MNGIEGGRIRYLASVMVVVVVAIAGCLSPWEEQRQAAITDAHEREALKSDLKRLEARVEQLAAAQQDAYRELERIRSANSDALRRMREDVATVQETLKAIETARARDREEIVSVLSKQIAELLRNPTAPTTRTERGFEHVVKPGETLSSIAAIYKVKPSVIVEANQLKDPNRLLVGTKLFIPEAGSGR